MKKFFNKFAIFLIGVLVFNLCLSNLQVNAQEIQSKADDIILVLENPINGQRLTEDSFVKGYVTGNEDIDLVTVYVNGKEKGTANIGINRDDVAQKYPQFSNSAKSGFTFNLTGVPNGSNTLKIVATNTKSGAKKEVEISINVSNIKTPIMGQGSLKSSQMVRAILNKNTSLDIDYVNSFVSTTIKEANIEGVNYDIAFAQMMLETGYLKFGGDVKLSQNNFAGLGATGNGNPGESFPTMEIGIRAVIQHIKAYASSDDLKQSLVDTRFKYVTRSSAIYVEHLGIKENPNGLGWAASVAYGYNILNVLEYIKSQSTVDLLNILDIKLDSNFIVGEKISATVLANRSENVLYKIEVVNKDTGESILLKDFSNSNVAEFTPKTAGEYEFIAYAKAIDEPLDGYSSMLRKSIKVELKSVVSNFSVNGDYYVNNTLTIEAESLPDDKSEYKFWVCDRSTETWTVLSDYSSTKTVKYTPKKAAEYTFVVYTRHKSNGDVKYDDLKSIDFVIKNKVSTGGLSVTGSQFVNEPLKITATGSPEQETLYKIFVCDRSTDTWTVLSDYSEKNIVEYTPKKTGNYSIVVHVRNKYSDNTSYDNYYSKDIQITAKNVGVANVKSFSVNGDKYVNNELTLTAESSSNDAEYKFWVCDRSTETWTVLSDYSSTKTVKYTPKKAAEYTFVVYTRHKSNGDVKYDDLKSIDFVIKNKVSTGGLSVTGSQFVNEPLKITATGSPEQETLYKIFVCDRSTDTWTVLSDYSEKNIVEYTPKKTGNYSIVVHVRNKYSDNTSYDNYYSKDIYITEKDKSKLLEFKVTGDFSKVGSEINVTATAAPEKTTLYKFFLCDTKTDTWTTLSEYSLTNTIKFKINKESNYRVVVHVKNINNNCAFPKDYDDYLFFDYAKTVVIDPGHNLKGYDTGASATHNGTTYREEVINMEIAEKLRDELINKGYKVLMTGTWDSDYKDTNTKASLQRRVNFANEAKADFFVSIHQNSATDKNVKGVEVYYTSLAPIDTALAGSNWSLSNKISTSKSIGLQVVNALSTNLEMVNRGLKDQELYVTKNTLMPAILVECGFLSNLSDVSKISSSQYQSKIAKSIAEVIAKNV